MKIAPEIKAKIFAQYWGQKVLYIGGAGLVELGKGGWNLKHPEFFLQLKPLSVISDDDAIKVSEILYDSVTRETSIINGKEFSNDIEDDFIGDEALMRDYIYAIQYLQSKGYALPYMEYSVEDLVKAGIYRIDLKMH